MDTNSITIWPFEKAPEEYAKLTPWKDGETWLVFVPDSIRTSYDTGFIDCLAHLWGPCAEYGVDGGRVSIFVG